MTNPSTTDPSIIIADDEPDLAALYQAYLTPEYDVDTAMTGDATLKKVDESTDIIYLDRWMPDMTGEIVLSELHDRGYEPQVAMLTAVDPEPDLVELPIDLYLTKPVTQANLISTVEALRYRSQFAADLQVLFRDASKKAAMDAAGNTDSEAYNELTQRIAAQRDELADRLEPVAWEDVFPDSLSHTVATTE